MNIKNKKRNVSIPFFCLIILILSQSITFSEPITLQTEEYFNKANDAFFAGNIQEAITYSEKAIAIDPDHASAYHALSVIYFDLGEFQKSATYGEKAIEKDPKDNRFYQWLASVYIEMGNERKAIANWKSALELNPEDADSCGSIGYVYYESGQYQEAKQYLLKAKGLYEKQGDIERMKMIEEVIEAILEAAQS